MIDNYAGHYLSAVSYNNDLAERLQALRARLVETARMNGRASEDDGEDSSHLGLDYWEGLCDRAGLLREPADV